MPQFFISSSDISGNKCFIKGNDYHHLVEVRRVSVDDILKLRREDGILLSARIEKITESFIEAVILEQEDKNSKSVNLTLCLALLKGKKFDLVVQKAVELGVSSILPVYTERCIPVPGKGDRSKLDRWNRIALEAAKQCMREDIPVVKNICRFDELVTESGNSLKIIAHPGADKGMKNYLSEEIESGLIRDSVFLLVGPEGGFSPQELECAEKNSWQGLNFGFTQLRAETAAIALSSIIVYEWSGAFENNT